MALHQYKLSLMTYKVTVKPEQVEAFQKLLRAWKFVGVVEDYQVDLGGMEAELPDRGQSGSRTEKTSEEMADLGPWGQAYIFQERD